MLKKLFFTAALSAFALWGAAQTTISGERNCGTSPMTHGLKELMQTALQQMASPLQEQNGLLMQKAAKRSMELNTPND